MRGEEERMTTEASLVQKLVAAIRTEFPVGRRIKIMHVCGSHEHSVQRWGIRSMLPEGLEIFAGPGCPVCVCPAFEVGEAIALAKQGVLVATYGDMLQVPTPGGTLMDTNASGGDVRVVYGPMDAVRLARENPDREVVFFSIGFETTIAPSAALVAAGGLPPNFSLLTSHRLTPPAMELLLGIGDVHIDGFIAPGHVSVIVGSEAWSVFPRAYRMPVVVAGFEPDSVLLGILLLVRQLRRGEVKLENAYPQVVRPEGNPQALRMMEKTFVKTAAWWRGIGRISRSGLVLKPEFAGVDARKRFGISASPESTELPPGCSCHLVMLGKIHPPQCPMFNRKCTPDTPYGPCMVSQEGTCLIWSKFGTPVSTGTQ
jgi:hydrogenase expression/formation protein HypD